MRTILKLCQPASNNINRVGLKNPIVLYFVAKNLAMSLRTTFCKIVSMWHLGGIRFSATMMFRMFGRPPPLGVGYLYKHHEHNHFHHHLCLDHNNGNYDHDDHSDFIKVIPCGRSVGVAMSLAS